MNKINDNLKKLNIVLAEKNNALANYTPYVISNNTIYISGQIPIKDSKLMHFGKLGYDISNEDIKDAAQICVINIISILNSALDGELEKIKRCLKIGVFINCTEKYEDHPFIADFASDFIIKILGEKGIHSRFAVGVSSLPKNAPIEIDAIFEITN